MIANFAVRRATSARWTGFITKNPIARCARRFAFATAMNLLKRKSLQLASPTRELLLPNRNGQLLRVRPRYFIQASECWEEDGFAKIKRESNEEFFVLSSAVRFGPAVSHAA